MNVQDAKRIKRKEDFVYGLLRIEHSADVSWAALRNASVLHPMWHDGRQLCRYA